MIRTGKTGTLSKMPKTGVRRKPRFISRTNKNKEPCSCKNFLTINVECAFHSLDLRKYIPKSVWHLQESRILSSMERLLGILDKYQTTATFFVLGWIAEHQPEVVHMIDSAGHEIGTHGHFHSPIAELVPEEFEEDLERSLAAIGNMTAQSIRGYRGSNFIKMDQILWALPILTKYGIEYDSTVFSTQRKQHSFRGYPYSQPHTVQLGKNTKIKEFPLSTQRIMGRNLPVWINRYSHLLPFRMMTQFITRENMRGKPVLLCLNSWELETASPRVNLSLPKRLQHCTHPETSRAKLIRLLENHAFTSIRNGLTQPKVVENLEQSTVDVPFYNAVN